MKFTKKGFICLQVSVSKVYPLELLFSVEDSGIGIQEDKLSNLFTYFGKVTNAESL